MRSLVARGSAIHARGAAPVGPTRNNLPYCPLTRGRPGPAPPSLPTENTASQPTGGRKPAVRKVKVWAW
eukprot:scaffold77701_cov69-Phaeocystis_antarctica.AAC.1